jgi:plastocyanin
MRLTLPKTAVAVALLSSAGFASASPAPSARAVAPAAETIVHIANFTFQQPSLSLAGGTTVIWINDDDVPHTVVARDGSFKSHALDTGDRFSFTFVKPGQFDYYCSLHPHMTGRVTVRG